MDNNASSDRDREQFELKGAFKTAWKYLYSADNQTGMECVLEMATDLFHNVT